MTSKTKSGTKGLRNAMILTIVVLAFVASYQLATAANGGSAGNASAADSGTTSGLTPTSASDSGAGSAGCACCGDTGSGETIEGAAVLEGDVQKITVAASSGYNPNVIKLTAGVPAEITFTNASSCLGQVISEDLGFSVDFNDGPKTVRIEADQLQPGEYGFSCSMQMVFGTIVVE